MMNIDMKAPIDEISITFLCDFNMLTIIPLNGAPKTQPKKSIEPQFDTLSTVWFHPG